MERIRRSRQSSSTKTYYSPPPNNNATNNRHALDKDFLVTSLVVALKINLQNSKFKSATAFKETNKKKSW